MYGSRRSFGLVVVANDVVGKKVSKAGGVFVLNLVALILFQLLLVRTVGTTFESIMVGPRYV